MTQKCLKQWKYQAIISLSRKMQIPLGEDACLPSKVAACVEKLFFQPLNLKICLKLDSKPVL